MIFSEALAATFNDNEQPVLLSDADPDDACGFVKTDTDERGFFWCVCNETCRCSHCKENKS